MQIRNNYKNCKIVNWIELMNKYFINTTKGCCTKILRIKYKYNS